MREHDADLLIIDWLTDGPRSAPDRLVQDTLTRVRAHPQRQPVLRWGDLAGATTLRRPTLMALRLAFIVVAVALISGLLGSFIGSQRVVIPPVATPTPTASATTGFVCPAGTHPGQPGPREQARPRAGGRVLAAVDRQSGLLVAYQDGDIWHLDLCTNTWRQSAATVPQGVRGLTSVYAAESDRVVIFGVSADASVSHVVVYDADSESATLLEGQSRPDRTRAAYDPVGDLIYVLDAGQLWTYDVDRNAWHEVVQRGAQLPGTNESVLMAYDAAARRIVAYRARGFGSGDTYEFDPGPSAWTLRAGIAPPMPFFYGDVVAGMEMAYDEASARTIVFNRGRAIAYDATADSWDVVYDSPVESDLPAQRDDLTLRGLGVALAYDPVNKRTIAIGGSRLIDGAWIAADTVIAFDLDTRSWIELLAPATTDPEVSR